jgi:hypothetical protein
MWNRPRALLVPAAVALALAACGSGKGSTSDSTSSGCSGDHGGREHRGDQRPEPRPRRATTVPAGDTTPTDEAVSGDAQEIILNVDDPAQSARPSMSRSARRSCSALSDTDQEYHVHGYDLEKQAAAGVETTFEFTADTGRQLRGREPHHRQGPRHAAGELGVLSPIRVGGTRC